MLEPRFESDKKATVLETAVFLCDHLAQEGIDTVLSGGTCVSIYTENRYLSYDFDFVLLDHSKRKKIRSVLERIGYLKLFARQAGYRV